MRITIVVLFLLLPSSLLALPGNFGTIVLRITDLKPLMDTSVRVAICQSQRCYDSNGADEPYVNDIRKDLISVQKVSGPQMQIIYNQVPPGNYSIYFFHDRYGDGKAKSKTCFFGRPYNGVGWSGNTNPITNLGKPSWDQVKFQVLGGMESQVAVHTIYMCD
jgi:uncharacterized protein (DUF2141 family)